MERSKQDDQFENVVEGKSGEGKTVVAVCENCGGIFCASWCELNDDFYND